MKGNYSIDSFPMLGTAKRAWDDADVEERVLADTLINYWFDGLLTPSIVSRNIHLGMLHHVRFNCGYYFAFLNYRKALILTDLGFEADEYALLA